MDFERFDRANSLSRSGQLETASQEFEALAQEAEDQDDKNLALFYQAGCLQGLGRISEARRLWSVVTAFRTSPGTEVLDASLCISEGKQTEALQKLTRFLEDHVDLRIPGEWNAYSDAQYELGKLLFSLERDEEAIKPLEGVLASAKGDEGRYVRYLLGLCYYTLELLDKAEEYLLSVEMSGADSWWVRANFYLGCIYFKKGNSRKAKKSFEVCERFKAELDPELRPTLARWLSYFR